MDNFLNPSEILKKLKLQKDAVAADFGSGSGGWVLPLAKILENGHIFAIDILEEPLSALKIKAKSEKLENIETVKSDIEKTSKLFSESCDLVLMTNLLFQAENKRAIIEEAKRVLRKKGKILVVDWKKDAAFGPEPSQRVQPEEIKQLAEDFGFKLEKFAPRSFSEVGEFEASLYHYGLVFKK